MGWIFMDYRNDANNLNQNTIIYGHNVKGGIMFGTMGQMFNNSYLARESNNYITLNTKNANMKFKIFSMYRTPTTTDYLQTEFLSKEEYRNFLDMIKSRSQYALDATVDENDKILTLSTCHSNTSRNVIHAKLVEVTNTAAVEEVEPVTESPTTVTEETTTYVGN
jgi:sortase B